VDKGAGTGRGTGTLETSSLYHWMKTKGEMGKFLRLLPEERGDVRARADLPIDELVRLGACPLL